MDYFRNKDNELYCEDVPVGRLAAEYGTPTYVYSASTLRDHYNGLKRAFSELDPLICYSVKGCSNINILRIFAELGSGFDVVSGGELFRVLQVAGDASKVVYAGVGKTDSELNQAIAAGIGYFNIESEAELENLIGLAGSAGRVVKAALRVNPNVDPKTHRHTTTGKKETKFGVDIARAIAVFERYGRAEAVRLDAIHLHIGSPVNSVEPYVQAIEKSLELIDQLRNSGFEINAIDIGGGFGADYVTDQAPLPAVYADAIVPLLRDKNLAVILEPGRSISGNAGILLTEVLYIKQSGDKKFAIVDAGMNDLIRPAFYDAFHFIWPTKTANGFQIDRRSDPVELDGMDKYDIVGPICETGDFLAKGRMLPPLARGDLLAVFTAGAYAFAMSSEYNSRPRAAEILVDGDSVVLIRRRETYQDLIAPELG